MRFPYASPTALLVALLVAGTLSAQTRYEWVGGTSGDWTEASNWSPTGVPVATDTAVIGETGQGQRLAVLTAHTTVAGLELIGQGAVAGDFDLTVTADFLWAAGGPGIETFRGSGTVTNAATSTLHMAEGTPRFQMSSGRTLVNDGLIIWDGSGGWNGQGRLVNNGEVLLAMGGTDLFVFSSLPDAITNTATGLIRRDGAGLPGLSSGVVNDGLIRVESGTLVLSGFNSEGLRGTGSVVVEPGAELLIDGGTHVQDGVTGDRVVLNASSRRLEVNDTYDVATTRILLGSLQLDTDGTIGTLEIESGGALTGSGDVTVTGSLDWGGGDMGGSGTTTLGPSIPLTIDGGNLGIRDTRTLRTEGAVTWTGDADIAIGTSATFENAGVLTSSGAGQRGVSFGTFLNTGTLVHDGGALEFFSGMSNEGTVRVLDGTVRQQGSNSIGGTDTGRYELMETGRLAFTGGTRTLTQTAEVVGTGTVTFGGGSLTNRAAWRPGASPGTLTVDSNWPAPAPESTLDIEIGGTAAGTDFDQFVVMGTASLGGTLRVSLVGGFEPTEGDRFLFVSATGGATGAFDALDLPSGLDAFVETSALGAALVIGVPVSNEGEGPVPPDAFALHAGYPNPFAERATLRYDLPVAGRVRLAVYDVLGREIAVLVDADRLAGSHTARLDGTALPSGVYHVRMTTAGFAQSRRLTLTR